MEGEGEAQPRGQEDGKSSRQEQTRWKINPDACPRATAPPPHSQKHHTATRQPAEVARGTVRGAVNFPLSTLRQRLDELPRDRRIYVFCQVRGVAVRCDSSCNLFAACASVIAFPFNLPSSHDRATPSQLQVGLRGYNATRQLLLSGRDAVNITGGWRSALDAGVAPGEAAAKL